MMKYSVIIMHTARNQLRDIATIYRAKVGVKSAKRITDKLLKNIKCLEHFPNLGVVPNSTMLEKLGYHMLIVDDYLCFYKLDKDIVYINQILHSSVDYVKFLLK